MYLGKYSFINILLILVYFCHISLIKAIDAKLEKNYLVNNNTVFLVELELPKSKLLIKKKIKNNQNLNSKKIINKKEAKKDTKKKEYQIKEKKIKKLENRLIKITIKYSPDEVKPDKYELNIFENKISRFSKLSNLTIEGYAEKKQGESSSNVRRLSLKRALFLREIFLKNKYKSTKIYVKAMGDDINISGSKDVVIISSKLSQ